MKRPRPFSLDDRYCAAVVYKRDTYRVARGTKSGFAMHYDRCRCSRLATVGKWCTQHSRVLYKEEYA